MTTAIKRIRTPFGEATLTSGNAGPLTIHKVANIMWLPMALMGLMAIIAAVALGIVHASLAEGLGSTFDAGDKANAEAINRLAEGFAFFGMALLLSGISFVLAAILGALRSGGGEVQESIGAQVKTLSMSWSAKTFMALMMMGMMGAIAAFITSIVASVNAHDAWSGATAAGVPADIGSFNTVFNIGEWMRPLAITSISILLTGIAFALYVISNVLAFQFVRIRELIAGQEETS